MALTSFAGMKVVSVDDHLFPQEHYADELRFIPYHPLVQAFLYWWKRRPIKECGALMRREVCRTGSARKASPEPADAHPALAEGGR